MEKPMEPKAKFHIEILAVLKDAQQQHGLRHKDFQSYHQYISRKLHRMRKSLNFQQGKGVRVIPKKITKAILSDSRFLLIKLFEAERAWAHAMQLKSEANTEPRKVFHMRSRLKKAVERAGELWELCKWSRCECAEHEGMEECELCSSTDAHTYLESRSYYYWMQAVRYFEISEWRKARLMFEKALTEYSGLAKAVDNDRQLIYGSKCEELRPLMRYCAQNEGTGVDSAATEIEGTGPARESDGADPAQFSELLGHVYRRQVATVTEARWLDMVIPVRVDSVRLLLPALADANRELERINSSEQPLSATSAIALLDSLLKSCTDSIAAVRDELKTANMATNTATAATANNPSQLLQSGSSLDSMTRLQILFVYLHYVKLTKTAERNLLIIENSRESSAGKPQSMARLFDTVVQNLQELAALPGLSGGGGSGAALQAELQAKIWTFTAFRCYHLSQAHLLSRRFAECAALLARALRHCESAQSSLVEWRAGDDNGRSEALVGVALGHRLVPGPSGEEVATKVSRLIDQIGADQLICRADRCLSLIDDVSADNGVNPDVIELPLLKRLDEFVEDPYLSRKTSSQSIGRLIDSSPDFEAIPVKPVFFDLAFYHVKFPSLDDKVKDRKSKAADNRGLTGMVKGWIWGSK